VAFLDLATPRRIEVYPIHIPTAYHVSASSRLASILAADLAVVQCAAGHGVDIAAVVLVPLTGALLELLVLVAGEQRPMVW